MTKKNYNKRAIITQVLMHVYLVVLLFLVLFPFYIMIVNSFKTPTEYYENIFALPAEWVTGFYKFAWIYVKGYFKNTLIIAVTEVFACVLVNSMAAYGFTRYNFKGREVLFMMILALMMIPGVLTLIPSYSLVASFGLLGTLLGVMLPQIASPFNIYLLRSFFNGLPKELFEAAEIDGASQVRQYLTLAIPLSKPILFTVGLSVLMGAWNDLVWPRLILLGQEDLYTISVGIMELTGAADTLGMGISLAAYVLVSIPLVVAFFFTSKQFISGLTSGAFKM